MKLTYQGFQNLVGKNGTDSLWLYYCISSKSRELIRRDAGSTFREVSRDSVRNLPVLFPPLLEQRAIAVVLDSVDAAIERARGALRSAVAASVDLGRALDRSCASGSTKGEAPWTNWTGMKS